MPGDALDPEFDPELGDVTRTSGAEEEADDADSLAGVDGTYEPGACPCGPGDPPADAAPPIWE